MPWGAILRVGMTYGLVFSVGFTVAVFAGALFARDFMVNDYPPAIRERFGPRSRRGTRVGIVVAVVVGALLIGVMAAGLLQVRAATGALGFMTAFATAAVIVLTFNLFDLLILDWLVFVLWRPRIAVLPGTEGTAEYGDWRFHLDGFVKGLGICTVGALLAAVAAVAVARLNPPRLGSSG
jgi:hypothetical protein